MNKLQPEIRRGRIDQLVIYDIQEHELDILERGGSTSFFLGACRQWRPAHRADAPSMFLLSSAISQPLSSSNC